ncbi:glycosyltransferase family 4 protein [Cerasicoccus frondis]|uniref:glycosyltransferase family 4 protein n=1 Tax=Cerasicoccus frondis TaxID=490090 RepID=UPI0028528FE1|nr:glycosyltransferase family 4 protein [Cerasicoccus frondis]
MASFKQVADSIWNFLSCWHYKLKVFIYAGSRLPNQKRVIGRARDVVNDLVNAILKGERFPSPDEFATLESSYLALLKQKIAQHQVNGTKRVCLITHVLNRTGAPFAAFQLAQGITRITGAKPVIIGEQEGPLRKEFEDADYLVLLSNELPFTSVHYSAFFEQFDTVIANSVSWSFFECIKHVQARKVWWSHEFFENEVEIERLLKASPHIDHYIGVSEAVRKDYLRLYPHPKHSILPYGLDHIDIPPKMSFSDPVVFTIIGTIEKRKGIDIFLEAITALPEAIMNKSEFIVIGDNYDEGIFKKLKDTCAKHSNVQHLESMPFEELLQVYRESDVVVSASRKDPMPIVLTHALMFSRLCLCPDSIGTASLLTHDQDGVIYPTEDHQALANSISNIVNKPDKHLIIARAGKAIYEQHFSLKTLQRNIEQILRGEI